MELHYFCLRGLGELPRLMLEVTGTAYDSVMYFDSKEYRLQSIRVASLCVSLRVSACLCVPLCAYMYVTRVIWPLCVSLRVSVCL